MLLLAACLVVNSVVHLIGTCEVMFSGYPTYQIRSNSVAFVKARTLASCELDIGVLDARQSVAEAALRPSRSRLRQI